MLLFSCLWCQIHTFLLDLKEQHTSIFTQWHASQLAVFTNVSLNLFQIGDSTFRLQTNCAVRSKQTKTDTCFKSAPTFLIKFIQIKMIATTFLSFHKVSLRQSCETFLVSSVNDFSTTITTKAINARSMQNKRYHRYVVGMILHD